MGNRKAISARAISARWTAALMFIVCGPIYLDYWGYSFADKKDPRVWLNLLSGHADAPEQYRIGVVRLSWWISQHLHIGTRHAFAIIDLIAVWVAVLLLQRLLEQALHQLNATDSQHLFCNALLIGLTSFYLIWLTWYQRPETLPSLAFVVATLFLVTHRLAIRGGRAVAVLLVLALTTWQSWVRADVAFAMHAGIALTCVLGAPRGDRCFVIGRGLQVGISLVAMLMAGGTQWYIVHYLYPHAIYHQGTQIIAGWDNFAIQRLIPFVLFMAPFGFTWLTLVRLFRETATGARVMLSAAAIYLVMWFMVGSFAEERIFLPFAMAISPWSAICAARWLGQDADRHGDKSQDLEAPLVIQ
jgi:hypothetical protein